MTNLIALTWLFATAPTTIAQRFAHVRQAYEEANFADAIAEIDQLLAAPQLSDAERESALLLLASCHVGLGNDDAARRRFIEILQRNPKFVLPRMTSPKIRSIFDDATLQLAAAPAINRSAPFVTESPLDPKQVVLHFDIQRGTGLSAFLLWRLNKNEAFRELKMALQGGQASAPIAHPPGQEIFEFYVALRVNNRTLQSFGSETAPMQGSFPQPKVEATPVYKRWWLWTAVGVVALGAAGGATAIYFATRPAASKTATVDVDVAR